MAGSAVKSGGSAKSSSFGPLFNKYVLIAILAALALIIFAMTPAAFFIWSIPSFQDFFENNIGVSPSLSQVFSLVFAFFYYLAFPSAISWLVWGKRDLKSLAIGLASILFVFGSKPLMFYFFATPFTAQGPAQKCYAKRGDDIVFLEIGKAGCPIDTLTGLPTYLVTPEVIKMLARKEQPAQEIDYRAGFPQFFDGATGEPLVWYEIDTNGRIRLFDGEQFSPYTGRPLAPIDEIIIDRLRNERRRALRLQAEAEAAARVREADRQQSEAARLSPPTVAQQAAAAPPPRPRARAGTQVKAAPDPVFVVEAQGNTPGKTPPKAVAGRTLKIETPLEGQ